MDDGETDMRWAVSGTLNRWWTRWQWWRRDRSVSMTVEQAKVLIVRELLGGAWQMDQLLFSRGVDNAPAVLVALAQLWSCRVISVDDWLGVIELVDVDVVP